MMNEILREFLTPSLTLKRAELIRHWRITGNTYRSVALLAARAWPDWGVAPSHPEYGETLCELAAEMLGEDPYQHPWN